MDQKFDLNNIPYDVIWLDIEHTDSKKYFTWDLRHFPDPKFLQQHIATKGRKMVNNSSMLNFSFLCLLVFVGYNC